MSKFYIKNARGEFVECDVTTTIFTRDLEDSFVLLRVGTDEHPAKPEDINLAQEAFANAKVLEDLNNVTVMLIPHQMEVLVGNKDTLSNKTMYIRILNDSEVYDLEEGARILYDELKGHGKTVLLPAPISVEEYLETKEIIKRAENRRTQRNRIIG